MSNSRPYYSQTLILLLALALLPSCHPVRMIYRDRSFTCDNVVDGQLGIAGVTVPDRPDYYASPYVEADFYRALCQYWPQVRVYSTAAIRSRLGRERHRHILEDFRELAVLPESDLAKLAEVDEFPRYLVFVDLRVNRVKLSEGYYSYEEDDGDSEYRISRSASRYLKALFIVYDLSRQTHVWIAINDAKETNSRSKTSSVRHFEVREPYLASPADLMQTIMARVVQKLPRGQPAHWAWGG